MLECASNGSFIVANIFNHDLIKFNRDGAKVGVVDKKGGKFKEPVALAALPDRGMVMLSMDRFQVFHCLQLRREWVSACAALSFYGRSIDESTAKRVCIDGLQ